MNRHDIHEMRLRKADEAAAMKTKPDPDAESVESFLARGGVIEQLPPCTFARDANTTSWGGSNRDNWTKKVLEEGAEND